jgi:hypothetical protein
MPVGKYKLDIYLLFGESLTELVACNTKPTAVVGR